MFTICICHNICQANKLYLDIPDWPEPWHAKTGLIINREAGEIIRLVASVCLCFAKYSKRSSETQVSYTLKNIIECSSQGAFKMAEQSKWLLFRQVAPSRSITLLIEWLKQD